MIASVTVIFEPDSVDAALAAVEAWTLSPHARVAMSLSEGDANDTRTVIVTGEAVETDDDGKVSLSGPRERVTDLREALGG